MLGAGHAPGENRHLRRRENGEAIESRAKARRKGTADLPLSVAAAFSVQGVQPARPEMPVPCNFEK